MLRHTAYTLLRAAQNFWKQRAQEHWPFSSSRLPYRYWADLYRANEDKKRGLTLAQHKTKTPGHHMTEQTQGQ